MRISIAALAAIVGATFHAGIATAQTQSLFGNRGPLTQTTPGSSTLGSAGSGRGTTTSSRGGTSGTGAAFEQGGPAITTQLGSLSGTVGTGGFIGRSDNAGRFVGNEQAGQQTVDGGNGGGNFGGRGGQQNPNQGGPQGTQAERRVIRPVQRIAFDFPAPEAGRVGTRLTTRIAQLSSRRPELAGVTVTIDERGLATVSGSVPSPDAAKLAEAMVRLEPGVRSIRSELAIGATR